MAQATKQHIPSSKPISTPFNDGYSGLYALRSDGVCLMPISPDGERLVFDTRRKPEPGDFVAIWFRPGAPAGRECWCKLLVAEDADELVVEQFNPPRQYLIDRRDVVAVHWCTLSLGRPRPVLTFERSGIRIPLHRLAPAKLRKRPSSPDDARTP